MKKWCSLVLLLLLGVSVLAEEREGQPSAQSESSKNKSIQSEEKATQKKQQPAWPRPYSPTEEVRADSVVPFPVDI